VNEEAKKKSSKSERSLFAAVDITGLLLILHRIVFGFFTVRLACPSQIDGRTMICSGLSPEFRNRS
jgi:hypothetical protein